MGAARRTLVAAWAGSLRMQRGTSPSRVLAGQSPETAILTLAPIVAVALANHQPRYAFLAGLATAIGAGISMAFSEGLSDTP